MTFISSFIGLLGGIVTSITYANAYPEGATWWQIMLIAIIPGLVSNATEFAIYWAKNKGWLDKEDADSIIERKRELEDEKKKEEVENKEEQE